MTDKEDADADDEGDDAKEEARTEEENTLGAAVTGTAEEAKLLEEVEEESGTMIGGSTAATGGEGETRGAGKDEERSGVLNDVTAATGGEGEARNEAREAVAGELVSEDEDRASEGIVEAAAAGGRDRERTRDGGGRRS